MPEELTIAMDIAKKKIKNTGLFSDISFEMIDRDGLIKAWSRSNEPIEAKVQIKGCVAYGSIRGVEEAYICVIPAKSFIDSLLQDEDGRIHTGVFEENVRAFLGESNPVNNRIQETLTSDELRNRFAILNNGITIVSPDIRVQGDTISLYNYQIVNGCQTSHVLFRNRHLVNDETMLTVKVIEANDKEVVNQIVEATNSQSYIGNEKFLSLKSKAKNIEIYFNSANENCHQDSHIYFERREKQYAEMGI